MRGAISTIACSGLALAACSAPSVHVRAIADPGATLRGGGDELAAARSMLALNNVGLALEGFHKVEIEQPTNSDVYVGIAQCYAAMGRYDLESVNYEKALAYAPHDRSILAAYANSLDRQGEAMRAAQVRTELALAVAPPMQAPQTGTLTIKLPAARPMPTAATQSVPHDSAVVTTEQAKALDLSKMAPAAPIEMQAPTVALKVRPLRLAEPRSSGALFAEAAAGVSIEVHSAASVDPAAMPSLEPQVAAIGAPPRKPMRTVPAIALSDSVASSKLMNANLPIARPTPYMPPKNGPDTAALVARLAAIEPVIKPRELVRAPEQSRAAAGPRLERLSIGEVALVTTPIPVWKTATASAPKQTVAVQWLPIRTAETRPAIQLLNAARSQGLAARTRTALADRGWRRMRIGDYREVRERSVVLYSSEHAPTGRRLAAQFNCKAIEVHGKSVLVVLLGRDAASRKGASSRA